ncbi:MAG: GTP pyrophosphokinase [Methylococcaceae bacterium]|nr:GTP pyrophosphokinase [Methylococcaceae bacterium]
MRIDDLDKAIKLACEFHSGQEDKAGKPYILHPLRLMLKFQKKQEQVVAVLHDVVEDCDVTLEDLANKGFSELVIDALDCLSKRENEAYEAFIKRIFPNELARKIKIEDIKDNLDLTRIESINNEDLKRAMKYHKALRKLTRKPDER